MSGMAKMYDVDGAEYSLDTLDKGCGHIGMRLRGSAPVLLFDKLAAQLLVDQLTHWIADGTLAYEEAEPEKAK